MERFGQKPGSDFAIDKRISRQGQCAHRRRKTVIQQDKRKQVNQEDRDGGNQNIHRPKHEPIAVPKLHGNSEQCRVKRLAVRTFLYVFHGEVAGTKITRNIHVLDRGARYQSLAGVWMTDVFRHYQETDRKMNEEKKNDKEMGFRLGIANRSRHWFRSHGRSYYLLFRTSSNGDSPGNPLD